MQPWSATIFLGISGGYEISTDRLKGRGNKSKKFEISFTCARFSIEYYRMINWGEMTMTYIPDEGERFSLTDFTGLKRKMWGINSYYFFNNRHYSQAAAYGFSKRQLRSVGSLLSGISASHCNFTVRNYYLPDYLKDEDDDFDEDDEDTAFDYTDISLNLGYGYNWAISRQLLLNATGIIYSGVKYAHSKSMSDGGSTFWALNGKFRLGFVYNYGNFFGGVHGYIDGHLFNTGPYRFRRYLYDVSLIAGLQF
ncbi:MAG: DUF4421 family protein [Muribaculaceae bacterium]|nr:DUF4421 family protein [Muribaculaceae bacterium]